MSGCLFRSHIPEYGTKVRHFSETQHVLNFDFKIFSKMRFKLNIRQEKFCQEYVKSGNATAAMLEAYPSRKKWTEEAQNSAA